MAFDAFISYSSKDKIAANAACAVLESAGVRCWIAPRDIRPGLEYGAAIIEAMDRCRLMVLIFSSSANDSVQIHREIERAVTKAVPIVPVRIEEVAPTKSMEYFLGAIHWLDALTPPIEKHLQHLAETVKAILQVDAAARGASATDGPHKSSAPNPPPAGTARAPVGAGDFSSKKPARMNWLLPALGGAICVALIAAGVWLYQTRGHAPAEVSVAAAPSPAPKTAEALVPETVPFISDSERATIRNIYLSAPDHKALAVSTRLGFITGQKDEETAKAAALEACKRVSGTLASNCQLYAVGNAVVYTGGRPPMPPEPWVLRDPAIEKPFAAKDVPLVRDGERTWLEKNFVPGGKPKAVAIGPGRTSSFWGQLSTDEAVRRSLERCGIISGVACMIVAVDDVFVVPIPTTMEATGIFRASDAPNMAPDAREAVARRLGNATNGWNAVAVGASGRAGVMLKAVNEQAAIDGALADCGKQDRACHVIAIGPFTVQPIDPAKVTKVVGQQPQQPTVPAHTLVPEIVPFVPFSYRAAIRTDYLSAPDHKALAIGGPSLAMRSAFMTGQQDEETAKTAALAACQRVNQPNEKCQLYAVGNKVVYAGGFPPLPPEPWVVRDPATERPFEVKDVPLVDANGRTWLEKTHPPARKPKALALSQRGRVALASGQSSSEEAVRRSLELCGNGAGVACMIVAIDDVFVVSIPTTMKVAGFFRASNAAIAPEAREDVARRLGSSAGGWSAVAVGATGRPGLMLKAASEQEAIDGALADCGKQDRACRVIAIGPFSVEPLDPVRN